MGFLTGAAKLGSAVGALKSIANALFPDQITIRVSDISLDVVIDSVSSAQVNTGMIISDNPSEDKNTFIQNISKSPKSITLSCIFSNIPRLSNIRTGASATKFATALLLPEVGTLTETLINEEDSIAERLQNLRDVMEEGLIVQILGLPGQEIFNFVIESIGDTEDVGTGTRSRAVDITIREAFIVGLGAPAPEEAGLFSKITDSIGGALNNTVGALF